MNGIKLIDAMNSLPDNMIEEAIYSRKRAPTLRKKWFLPVACLFTLLLTALVFQINPIATTDNTIPPQQNEPPPYQLSEQELQTSIFAAYCPEYAKLGCELSEAGIHSEVIFHAIFTAPTSRIIVSARPHNLASNYVDKLIDLTLSDAANNQQYKCPTFRFDQFTIECLRYVEISKTTLDDSVISFSIIDNDYCVTYTIESASPEWITQAFENIACCYQ